MDRGWWSGQVPAGWSIGRLKDLVVITNGFPFDSARFTDSAGVPLVRIRDLLAGRTQTYFDGPTPPEVVVSDGDLLIGMDGDFNSVVWTGGEAVLNQRLCRLRASGGLDQRFLRYLIDLPLRYINSLTYATTVKHLSSVDIINERVPLPPIAAQEAIANYLDGETARIDALVMKKQRLVELLENRFRALQVATLTGQPSEARPHSQLGRLPITWEARRARFCTGGITVGVVVNPSSYFVENGVPFVHGTDVVEASIDLDNLKYLSDESNQLLSKSQIREGDVVAMRVGYPGRAAVVPSDLDGANCASVLIFRRSKILSPTILMEFLNSPLGRMQIEAVQYGAAQGVMNVSDAIDLVVPVPPADEQPAVLRRLTDARNWWNVATGVLLQQTHLLVEHRQALITAAVTGELEIPGVAA